MAGKRNLRELLIRAPKDLLQRYLAGKGIGENLRWSALGEKNAEPILRALQEAAETLRREIERDLQEIDDLANEDGARVLDEEARDRHHGPAVSEPVQAIKDEEEKAFYAFLDASAIFEAASLFLDADQRTRWQPCQGLREATPGTDPATKDNLEKALANFYRDRGMMGRCTVRHLARGGKLYWFAYSAGQVEAQMEYDDEDQLARPTRRPALELIFEFDPVLGQLRTSAPGDSRTVRDLEWVFGTTVLGVNLRGATRPDVRYSLDGLLSPSFAFPTDAADSVEAVRIRMLRLGLAGAKTNKRITLEVNTSEEPEAIHQLVEQVQASPKIPWQLVQVTAAELQIVFRDSADGIKAGTLVVHVGYPKSCSLKTGRKDDIAARLLKRWGIDVSGSVEGHSEQPGVRIDPTLRL